MLSVTCDCAVRCARKRGERFIDAAICWTGERHQTQPARLAGGNARLLEALCDGLPVLYNTEVTSVRYGSEGVMISTSRGQAINAAACVVTVPLGILKAGKIEFEPALPQTKLDAIRRLGCAPHSLCSVPTGMATSAVCVSRSGHRLYTRC